MSLMNASCEVTNGDETLRTLYSILLEYYIKLLLEKEKQKGNKGHCVKKKKKTKQEEKK